MFCPMCSHYRRTQHLTVQHLSTLESPFIRQSAAVHVLIRTTFCQLHVVLSSPLLPSSAFNRISEAGCGVTGRMVAPSWRLADILVICAACSSRAHSHPCHLQAPHVQRLLPRVRSHSATSSRLCLSTPQPPLIELPLALSIL